MSGLLLPQQGEVRIKRDVITEENIWDIRAQIGMVFQNPDNQFVGATVQDDVAFSLENNGVPHEEMVQRVKRLYSKLKWRAISITSRIIYQVDKSNVSRLRGRWR